jgi:hypothetical protein
MGSDKGERRQRRNFEEDPEEVGNSSRRPRVDPDERDEFDEWRRERGRRGRKRKDKARRRQRHDEDEFWPES